MPLLDHDRPPLSTRRPWESFLASWASVLAAALNRDLPKGFVALEQLHSGAPAESDVATFEEYGAAGHMNGPVTTAPKTVWLPAAAPLVIPATFPEGCTVEIGCSEGG